MANDTCSTAIVMGDYDGCGRRKLISRLWAGDTFDFDTTLKRWETLSPYLFVKLDTGKRMELYLDLIYCRIEPGQRQTTYNTRFYKKAEAAVILYAVDAPQTLTNAQETWAREARRLCSADVPIVLLGVKADLRTSFGGDTVSVENTQAVATKIGNATAVECSSLTGEGCKEFPVVVCESILAHRRSTQARFQFVAELDREQ
ncbi:uncharacterized protein V1518DRAFT_421644 [Limtongia smithiae]|uniref:uncharacterized protein n=1 Tax=Limtongia smithiae TaxID=1125753 RepID=UPI0034CDAAE1